MTDYEYVHKELSKTGFIRHSKEGDIIINEKYESIGQHYVTAIMPDPVHKPKGKAVEE